MLQVFCKKILYYRSDVLQSRVQVIVGKSTCTLTNFRTTQANYFA